MQIAQVRKYGYIQQSTTYTLQDATYSQPFFMLSDASLSGISEATAASLTNINISWDNKAITVTANATYDEINARIAYELAQTTRSNYSDPRTVSSTNLSLASGWSVIVMPSVTLTSGTNITYMYSDTFKALSLADTPYLFNAGGVLQETGVLLSITVLGVQGTYTGTGAITAIYANTTGTSTTLQISGFDAGSAVYVEDNTAIQKFYSASATGTVTVYIPPTGTGSWYYAVEKYGNQRQSDFFTFSGGLKLIVVKAIPDTGITQSNVSTLSAYTALETPDKIYDYVAYLRLSVPHISYGQITFKNGTSLDLQDASLLVNQSFSSVASFNFDTKLLTIKSTSLGTGVTYNKIITTPPETITANTTEVITVDVEDANGDSSVTILGGDGTFELWKVTTATATNDYATGTKLTTPTIGNVKFRFIGVSGYDMVGVDINANIRRRSSMLKGVYTQAFYVGDQIQLANNSTIDLIYDKVQVLDVDMQSVKGTGFVKDTHSLVNIAGYVDAIPTDVWSATTRTLTSSGGATLAEIEASTVLAKEAAATANKDAIIAAIGTGGGGTCDLTGIEADLVSIKASTNTIEAATSKMTFDGHYINAVAKVVEDKANYTLTPDEKLNIANAVQAAILNETDGQKILEAIVNAIGNENIDQVALVAAIRADIERTGGVLATRSSEANATTNKAAILTAVGTPLQAANYTAPDNATIAKINDVKAKTDLIPTNTATKTDIATLKTDLEASIGSFPTKEEISTEVWSDEPERLKRVATVETTGNQLAAFNH